VSDWKERATKRRDARHTAIPDIRKPGGSGRNTKRWCKGKIGIEHKPECREHNGIAKRKVLACSVCGKHLDYWFPYWDGLDGRRAKPSWVIDTSK
jgi:hypothetical protein